MKVILLKAVPKVGKPDDIVEVNEGYARNALFPKKIAIPATQSAIADLHRRQSAEAAEKAVKRTLLENALVTLAGKNITYTTHANEHGSLFSKIDAKSIAEYLLKEHRINVDPKCIVVPGGLIKKVGSHEIRLQERNFNRKFILNVTKK